MTQPLPHSARERLWSRTAVEWLVPAALLLAVLTGCSPAEQSPAVGAREDNNHKVQHDRSDESGSRTAPARAASQAASNRPLPRLGKGYKALRDRIHQPQPQELAAFLAKHKDGFVNPQIQAEATEKIFDWRREQIKGFTAADLLAAAREAGPLSLQEGYPLDNPVDRLGRTGGEIHLCLQFYPLIVEGDEGVEPLMAIIRDRIDDWYLRHFLVSCIEIYSFVEQLDDRRSRSFSMQGIQNYLTSYASRHRIATLQMLRTIVKDPRDNPFVRAAAVEPKRDWLMSRLLAALNADANLIAYRRKHSHPVEDAGSGDETTKYAPSSIPPPPVASATTPRPIYFDDLVREGKVTVTAETARKLRTIHREISQDIDDLEGILTREDQLPSRVKGAILGCAYYYHNAAVDADLRKKLAAFRKKYGSRRQSRLIDAR